MAQMRAARKIIQPKTEFAPLICNSYRSDEVAVVLPDWTTLPEWTGEPIEDLPHIFRNDRYVATHPGGPHITAGPLDLAKAPYSFANDEEAVDLLRPYANLGVSHLAALQHENEALRLASFVVISATLGLKLGWSRDQVYPLARPAEQSPARPFDPSTRHALSFPIPQGEAESATVKSWVAEMKTYADTATTVQQVMEHMVQTYPCALSDGQKKRLATRATGQLVLPRRTRYVTATVMLWKARRAIQGRYAARHEGVTHQELEDMMTQMAKDFEDSLFLQNAWTGGNLCSLRTVRDGALTGSSYPLKLEIAAKISPDHIHGVFGASSTVFGAGGQPFEAEGTVAKAEGSVGFHSLENIAWTSIQENHLHGPDYLAVFGLNLILLVQSRRSRPDLWLLARDIARGQLCPIRRQLRAKMTADEANYAIGLDLKLLDVLGIRFAKAVPRCGVPVDIDLAVPRCGVPVDIDLAVPRCGVPVDIDLAVPRCGVPVDIDLDLQSRGQTQTRYTVRRAVRHGGVTVMAEKRGVLRELCQSLNVWLQETYGFGFEYALIDGIITLGGPGGDSDIDDLISWSSRYAGARYDNGDILYAGEYGWAGAYFEVVLSHAHKAFNDGQFKKDVTDIAGKKLWMTDYTFPSISFDVTQWGPYAPTLGRLDHNKPHTSGFSDSRNLNDRRFIFNWNAARSNLSGSAWAVNRSESNRVDPWPKLLANIRDWNQRIPTPEQVSSARELLRAVKTPRVSAEADEWDVQEEDSSDAVYTEDSDDAVFTDTDIESESESEQ